MKIYDFDAMFDKAVTARIAADKGRHTEDDWEDAIPKLYDGFGDAVIKSIGMSPRAFYAAMSDDELVETLSEHARQNVPISGFFADEAEKRDLDSKLFPLLDGTDEEASFAMNFIGSKDFALKKYMEILLKTENEDLKEKCAELLKERADTVADEAIKNYKGGLERDCMLDIMSATTEKRDDILEILLSEFRAAFDDIPLKAGFLAQFGDPRALDTLKARIEEEDINYVDFREIRYAIESLGGETNVDRDFTDDKYYEIIKSAENVDIFEQFEDQDEEDK